MILPETREKVVNNLNTLATILLSGSNDYKTIDDAWEKVQNSIFKIYDELDKENS